MYQFPASFEDEKVIDYPRKLTFLSKEEIDASKERMKIELRFREVQKTLAKEVVIFLHGEEKYNKALKTTNTLFRGNIKELDVGKLQDILKGLKVAEIADELTLTDTLAQTGIVSSKREAREWINQGSIQISGDEMKDMRFIVSSKNAISKGCTLIKRGKQNYFVISQKQNGEKKIAGCSTKNLLQFALFVKP